MTNVFRIDKASTSNRHRIISYKKSHRPAVAFINIVLLINISSIRLDAYLDKFYIYLISKE